MFTTRALTNKEERVKFWKKNRDDSLTVSNSNFLVNIFLFDSYCVFDIFDFLAENAIGYWNYVSFDSNTNAAFFGFVNKEDSLLLKLKFG